MAFLENHSESFVHNKAYGHESIEKMMHIVSLNEAINLIPKVNRVHSYGHVL